MPTNAAYNKLIAAVLTALVTFLTALQQNMEMTLAFGALISGALAAVAVYVTENTDNAAASKFWAAALGSVGVGFSGVLAEAPVRDTMLTTLIAVIGAGIVFLVPNELPVTPVVETPVTPNPEAGR